MYYKYFGFSFCTVQNPQLSEESVSQINIKKCVTIAHLKQLPLIPTTNKASVTDENTQALPSEAEGHAVEGM